jgi:hypothetical protein
MLGTTILWLSRNEMSLICFQGREKCVCVYLSRKQIYYKDFVDNWKERSNLNFCYERSAGPTWAMQQRFTSLLGQGALSNHQSGEVRTLPCPYHLVQVGSTLQIQRKHHIGTLPSHNYLDLHTPWRGICLRRHNSHTIWVPLDSDSQVLHFWSD